MITEETLEDLVFAYSDNQHFSINPIALKNSLCKSCIPDNQNEPIQCKICG